jgi:hypothetical protein
MTPFLRPAVVGVALLVAPAAPASGETFLAFLTSAQEVPANGSTATGYARVVLNEAAGSISFLVVFSGLSSGQTMAHIHAPAQIGANVGVAIDLGVVGGTSGTISGTRSITPAQIAQLRAHLGYVNVHSVSFVGGEIRGQLAPARPVDFDGDGRTDYSVLRFPNVPPPDAAQITYHNLTSTAGYQAADFGDANTDFPTPGDYDGDGKDDFAVYRDGPTPGAPSYFYILRSSDLAFQAVQWGVAGDEPVSRDYDGDGMTDIAVFRRGASLDAPAFWYIRQSSTGTLRGAQWGTTGDVVSGSSGDAPVPDDYDGDGKFDLAVYRFGGLAPNNTFIVLRSSNGAAQFQPWGDFATDYVVPGDYDGDGKGEFAVARRDVMGSSPITWYILQTSNGALRAEAFGTGSDRMVQGDYDGDGRIDIATYRPGGPSFFYALASLSNGLLAAVWGLAGDFPTATYNAR